jgi:hypothetical protein
MKKKITLVVGSLFILGACCVVCLSATNKKSLGMVAAFSEIEALADCEITNKKGEVKFSCTGDSTCSDTTMGYTLTCDGTRQ